MDLMKTLEMIPLLNNTDSKSTADRDDNSNHWSTTNQLIFPLFDHPHRTDSSLKSLYFWVVVSLCVLGFLNNISSLFVVLRPRIRLTVCGFYFIVFHTSCLTLVALLAYHTASLHRHESSYQSEWIRKIFPFLYWTIIDFSISITALMAIENLLIRCFGRLQFRSRRCAVIASFVTFLLVILFNGEKFFFTHSTVVRSNQNSLWNRIQKANLNMFLIVSCAVHGFITISIFYRCAIRIKKKSRKTNRLTVIFPPSIFIFFSLFIYLTFQFYTTIHRFRSTENFKRVRFAVNTLPLLPLILAFPIYVMTNRFYFDECRQILCRTSPKYPKTNELLLLCIRYENRSLETVATISNLYDESTVKSIHSQIKLEV